MSTSSEYLMMSTPVTHTNVTLTAALTSLLSIALLGAGPVAAPAAAPASIVAIGASALVSVAPPRDLDFTPSELRLWRDPETGKHYWYMTYDVVNNTGQDQRFAPRIELVVDDGRMVRQGDGVPSSVTKALKEFLGNELLEDQFEILGMVLQGKPHAKSGLVVFAAEDLEPTELTVMVQGLSRETEKKPHPKTGELVTLRKTARIDYLVPGDPMPSGTVTFPMVTREWIFR